MKSLGNSGRTATSFCSQSAPPGGRGTLAKSQGLRTKHHPEGALICKGAAQLSTAVSLHQGKGAPLTG